MSNLKKVSVSEGSDKIIQGDLVFFPTETVYGLGGNCENENCVKDIYKCKNRPLTNPVLIHVCNLEMGKRYVNGLDNKLTEYLLKRYWPGPLTIIGEATDIVPNCVTANTGLVGVRCPDYPLALELIEKSNVGIAAPSANISGHVSSTKVCHLFEDFNNCDHELFYIEDFDENNVMKYGVESTIIKIENNCIIIYRYGIISQENLLLNLQDYPLEVSIKFRDSISDNNMISPGQILKHYSPNLETYLLKFCNDIHNDNWLPNFENCIVIDFGQHLLNFRNDCLYYTDLSIKGDISEALQNLYDKLRYCEKILNGEYILIYDIGEIKKENIECLYDKIYRASSGKILNIPYLLDDIEPCKKCCC